MKKNFAIALALLFTAVLYANEKYSKNAYFFTDTRLKLRESPNLSSDVLDVLDDGTCVRILEQGSSDSIDGIRDNWAKVRVFPKTGAGGIFREGWVFGGYLIPGEEVPALSEKSRVCLKTEKRFDFDKRGGSTFAYYYLEGNGSCKKLLDYSTDWAGPNYETRCYESLKISGGKKILYLFFTMMDDGPYGLKCYRIDLSGIAQPRLSLSYGGISGKEEFVRENVKCCMSYSESYSGTYERKPKKSYKMRKTADFSSEEAGTIPEDAALILDVGWISGNEHPVFFEDGKDGFWVQCRTKEDNFKSRHWIWVE